METHSVPKTYLAESKYNFEKPSLQHVKACFDEAHAAAERAYQGGGVWGESSLGEGYPPVYRKTAWRMIGYANALKVEDNGLYRRRLLEGAEYLLRQQQENGSYLWWFGETNGHPDTDHLLYCTANPGIALLGVYELTEDVRFLDASRKAADWAVNHRISHNNNYNSFAVWHLCEHYKVTAESRYLEAAIYRNGEGALPRQLANGAWAGHNAWIFYHSIIVNGLVALYGVLPDGHEAKVALREPMIMALNHLIEEQRPSGHFRSCFDPEEWQRSRDPESSYSVHKPERFDPFALNALVSVHGSTDLDMTNTLYGVLGSPVPEDLERQPMVQLSYGVGYRWLSEAK